MASTISVIARLLRIRWLMTVDEWVFEAVESAGSKGATVREVQRSIDEKHFEELAIDTIEAS
ncbi:MAG TPA: hypothetical protein VFN03_05380, partial [Trueperaceae bacterium]|nr:hypothetical protein [Trueperaceae bacterium]